VTQSAYAERFDETFRGHVVLTDTHAERISAQPAGQPARHADLDSLAYVMYTSGSTGRPKGVQIPHRGLANYLQWAAGDVASRGTGGAAVFSSVAFDLGVTNLWAPLLAGRPVHMMPQDLDLADLGRRLVDAGPFSFVKLTPGHLDILSQQISPEQAAGLAQTFVVGGEALPVQAANRWALMLGNDRLINEYGPTEASVAACMFPVTAPVIGESVPIGLPMPGASVHVLDEGLRRTPIGVAGEVYLAGAGLARGYRNRPDLTAERFLPDPFGPPGSRIYRTGDLARVLPDGNVDLIGRIDSQVKIRGYRVEPEEVAVVLREHPAVRDAVVISATGEAGQEFLAAYYVAAQTPSSPDDLRDSLAARCAANLPEYMVPSFFRLIDAIPLTASGKIDRKALPPVDDVLSADEVAPRGIVEERIAEIFTELLRTQVTAHGNFFRLGGNSILAIRLIARLQSAFEVSLPIRAIFEKPTVAGLAEVVEAAVRAEIDQMSDTELIADSAK
jgi:amino acid adenylation domain-containing protein